MNVTDFRRAVDLLVGYDINERVFILPKLPPLDEQEGVKWEIEPVEFAFEIDGKRY